MLNSYVPPFLQMDPWGDSDYGGDSSVVQEQLRGVRHVQATHRAFAAVLADGSIITWGNPAFGADSSAVRDRLGHVCETLRPQEGQTKNQAHAWEIMGAANCSRQRYSQRARPCSVAARVQKTHKAHAHLWVLLTPLTKRCGLMGIPLLLLAGRTPCFCGIVSQGVL